MVRLYQLLESESATILCPPVCGLNTESYTLDTWVLRFVATNFKYFTTFPRNGFKQGMSTVLNFLLVRVDLPCYLFNFFSTVTFTECLLYPMLYAKHCSGRSSCNNNLKSMKQVLLLHWLANEKIWTQRINVLC